ncbi:DUF397 domain-containing protein [Nocardia sp. CS682]|uniref:DUF397 domain-containing protein n=1 Tax=Nocardia sp. CS682 TaxID=1047172 RepID=UPI0010753E8B|nr:DUF397 domain-containing protein [Nocardia sp. CS682]QBS41318.1 DUF397 domain-containing protein [Nocardia sp. CS682]
MTPTIRPRWTISSHSGGNGGECVEVDLVSDPVRIRDTKFQRNPRNKGKAQPQIAVPANLWPEVCNLAVSMVSRQVSDALSVTIHPDGSATFSGRQATLFYTPAEMDAFAKGVVDGEFDLS